MQILHCCITISARWNQWWMWSTPLQPAGTSCCWCFEYHHENPNDHPHHNALTLSSSISSCNPLSPSPSSSWSSLSSWLPPLPAATSQHCQEDITIIMTIILNIYSSLVRTTSSSPPFEVLQSSTGACGRSRVTGKLWWIDLRPANCSALLLQYVLEIHKYTNSQIQNTNINKCTHARAFRK